jgi:CheY-like chemotaxis protein
MPSPAASGRRPLGSHDDREDWPRGAEALAIQMMHSTRQSAPEAHAWDEAPAGRESIGRMARGLAQHLDNMLSVILCLTDSLIDETSDGDRRREDLVRVRAAAQRAARLSQELEALHGPERAATGDLAPWPPGRRQQPGASPGALRGMETILLVQDDDLLRTALVRVLEGRGFVVLQAAGAARALELAASHPGHIALLVTELVLPTMSGVELGRELRRGKSDLRTLYLSGSLDAALEKSGVAGDEAVFVHRPITPHKLLESVRQVLGDQARALELPS